MEEILCKKCGTKMERLDKALSQPSGNYREMVGSTSVPVTGEVNTKYNSQKQVIRYLQYSCPNCPEQKEYRKS